MPHTQKNQGVTILMTLFFLTTVASFGVGLMMMMTFGMKISRQQRHNAVAFNCAESGAEAAAQWLRAQSSPPSGSSPIYPFGSEPLPLGAGTYTVYIVPDPGNGGAYLKKYKVVATGYAGPRTATVELSLRQASFGHYAYFDNQEGTPWGDLWFVAGMTLDGPVHSNNADGKLMNIYWKDNMTPIFLDKVTCVANSFNWDPRKPANETEYKKVFLEGSAGYQLGVQPIPLPATTTVQKEAAWGASSGYPTTDGVYVPNAGGATKAGIYIRGNVNSMTFSKAGTSKQLITIVQGSNTYKITVDLINNTTTYQKNSGTPTVYSGVVNGAIYSTGAISSLSGTIVDNYVSGGNIVRRSAYTVCTDAVAGKDITLTNNLQYETKPDKNQDANADVNLRAATMGLVTRHCIIGSTCPNILTIDATMVCGSSSLTTGTFYCSNWSTKKPPGKFYLNGGLIQYHAGVTGTFDPYSGTIKTGYEDHYSYDPRMADNPPPFFPTTGTYERLSWRRTYSD
jgi:hypothetical protein